MEQEKVNLSIISNNLLPIWIDWFEFEISED